MCQPVQIGDRLVGPGQPCVVIAELGANHSGSVQTALQMIRAAHVAGADFVKLQRRNMSMECIPEAERSRLRENPWGPPLPYAEYRRRLELTADDYDQINAECRRLGIGWFASAWDEPSVEFLMRYDPPCLKIASAGLTDDRLLRAAAATGRPTILSTGMSELWEINRALEELRDTRVVLLHCVSTYPAKPEELNLSCITMLAARYGVPVGFSCHATGVWAPLAAAVLGACMVEVHLSLDRSSWGTDQSASFEPHGLAQIVKYIRRWEEAKGDGIKRVYPSEVPIRAKLRRVL